MSNKKNIVIKEDVVQAVLIADNFEDEFVPISDSIPLSLIPLVNKPILDYTLEFLSLGGIEETFIFCCNHVEAIKQHIDDQIKNGAEWSQTMKVHFIISESCQSIGDCLRDLDAKALLRGTFVLTEPGVISNIKILPILKKHDDIMKRDKGAAMTLLYQESGVGSLARCLKEEIVIASNKDNRILFHKKLGCSKSKKIDFPLEIFLENSTVNIHHNLKNTHIAICSSSVLPLFSDNFDFQTIDDFVRGLLMNEEILGSSLYWFTVKGNQYGGAVTNWRTYQAISYELMNRWVYPIMPTLKACSQEECVAIGSNCKIMDNVKMMKSVVGRNVTLGKNVHIENSFIFNNVFIDDNSKITHSVISYNARLGKGCKVTFGSVIGNNVVLPSESFIENSVVQSTKPLDFDSKDKIGDQAYRLKLSDDEEEPNFEYKALAKRLSRLHLGDNHSETDDESDHTTDSGDELSYTDVYDETNMFYMEVIDSLTRGFEDKLACDNLILEINSSRYAYNVTLKEVNFNVVKAILNLPFQDTTAPYLQLLRLVLSYFTPILKNYIRNEEAMVDCLTAVEDVATASNELLGCVMQILNWFYDKDCLNEDSITNWYNKLDAGSRLHERVRPFVEWLHNAEEASSDEEDSE